VIDGVRNLAALLTYFANHLTIWADFRLLIAPALSSNKQTQTVQFQ